jgi:hypothetical protein
MSSLSKKFGGCHIPVSLVFLKKNIERKQVTFTIPFFSRIQPQQTVVFLVEYQNWQQNGGKMGRKTHFENTSIQVILNNDLQTTYLTINL